MNNNQYNNEKLYEEPPKNNIIENDIQTNENIKFNN